MGTTDDGWTVGGNLAVTGTSTLTGNTTVTGTLGVTGVATFTGLPVIPTVAFASLPAATTVGQVCYCATGNGGNPGLLVADGTNWITGAGATAAES